jgi:hypothetical protein
MEEPLPLLLLDVGFVIDMPASDEQATSGSFWTALQSQVSADRELPPLDVSFQEYLALDVELCPKGQYCTNNTLATQGPTPCPRGTFAPNEGSSVCTSCPAPLASPAEGSTDFRNCTLDMKSGAAGEWIPMRLSQPLDDNLELEPQLAALYGVPLEAIIRLP